MLKHAILILNYQIYHFNIKKIYLRNKCWWNYETSNGLENGFDRIFENFTKKFQNM
jgi:hypothetical protein